MLTHFHDSYFPVAWKALAGTYSHVHACHVQVRDQPAVHVCCYLGTAVCLVCCQCLHLQAYASFILVFILLHLEGYNSCAKHGSVFACAHIPPPTLHERSQVTLWRGLFTQSTASTWHAEQYKQPSLRAFGFGTCQWQILFPLQLAYADAQNPTLEAPLTFLPAFTMLPKCHCYCC